MIRNFSELQSLANNAKIESLYGMEKRYGFVIAVNM